jgi:hypothetical protein
MAYEDEIRLLESDWSKDQGFFWRIRQGQFHPAEFARVLQNISSVSFDEDAQLPRRIVSLLWYIPVFMEWQRERVSERGGDSVAYEKAITAMTNEIERLLGVP